MTGSAVAPANDGDIKALITALEKRALELWNGENPDEFIELSSDDGLFRSGARKQTRR